MRKEVGGLQECYEMILLSSGRACGEVHKHLNKHLKCLLYVKVFE